MAGLHFSASLAGKWALGERGLCHAPLPQVGRATEVARFHLAISDSQ